MNYVIKVNDPEQLLNYGFTKYAGAYYFNYDRGDTGIQIVVRDEYMNFITGRMKAPKRILGLFQKLYDDKIIEFETAKDENNIGNVILVDSIKRGIER